MRSGQQDCGARVEDMGQSTCTAPLGHNGPHRCSAADVDARRPIGSSTADEPNQRADDEQITGRIHSCLDYVISAADKGDMTNVRAWAAEIRRLVDVLVPAPRHPDDDGTDRMRGRAEGR